MFLITVPISTDKPRAKINKNTLLCQPPGLHCKYCKSVQSCRSTFPLRSLPHPNQVLSPGPATNRESKTPFQDLALNRFLRLKQWKYIFKKDYYYRPCQKNPFLAELDFPKAPKFIITSDVYVQNGWNRSLKPFCLSNRQLGKISATSQEKKHRVALFKGELTGNSKLCVERRLMERKLGCPLLAG